jgi:hypothetical protein
MPLDSSANLLFNIGANTDDAESNVQRFRALMGKNLDDLAGEFSDWSTEVIGELETVKGAMIASVAVIAAAGVAAFEVMNKAADKYNEFVGEVAHGSKVTGIAAEQMSVLKFAASQTGTDFETLVHGLTFFEAATAKANAGSQQQIKAFASLGISQTQIAAGEKDIIPLLELVMDKFHGLASGTDRASASRELFSRGGTELIGFLRLGADRLKEFAAQAKAMGLVVGDFDVEQMKKYRAAARVATEQQEAFDLAIGKAAIPVKTFFFELVGGIERALVDTNRLKGSWADIWVPFHYFTKQAVKGFHDIDDEIQKTAKAIEATKLTDSLKVPSAEPVEKLKQEFYALSSILEHVNERMESGQGEYEKATSQITHLAVELSKARGEYQKLLSEGKLSAESAAHEAASLNALPAAILALWTQLRDGIDAKQREAAEKAKETAAASTADLVKRIQDQHGKTIEAEESDWADEIAKLRANYAKKGQLTAENEALIAELQKQGGYKRHREQVQAYSDELLSLQQSLATILEANMNSEDRLTLQHELEIARMKREETEKLKLTKEGSSERLILLQQFAINEKAINDKYAGDLQALQNSQGWQGVFGSKFSSLIKGDEDLLRQWSQSTNQSLMLVKVTMEALKEQSNEMFEDMAKGMGSSIASAFVYKKSIKDAMEEAAKSELESIASRALIEAIYAAGWGFMLLAQGNYPGSAAAFESAAIFGTVAAAAGIAGRAVPTGSSGGASGTSTSQQQNSAFGADNQNVPAPGQSRPNVTVNVMGHVIGTSGISQLTSMINDAVLNQDVTLTATNTKTGIQVTK